MTKITAVNVPRSKTDVLNGASVGAQQTGTLAESAAKSPATTSLAALQAKADGAPIQFGRKGQDSFEKKKKWKIFSSKSKRSDDGAGTYSALESEDEDSFVALESESEDDFAAAGPATPRALASPTLSPSPSLAVAPRSSSSRLRRRSASVADGKREISDDRGAATGMVELLPDPDLERDEQLARESLAELDPKDDDFGGGLDVLEVESAPRGPLYAKDKSEGLTGFDAYKRRARQFLKHARRVDPEEVGGKSFASLRAEVQATIDAMPAAEVHPEDLTEGSSKLEHAKSPGQSAAAGAEPDGIDPTDQIVPEAPDKAERRLAKIIAKVRSKLSRLTPHQQDIAIVALALIQSEISKIIAEQKSAGSAARVILSAGPAGYLEEKVLPVLISHIPGDVKEHVPWSQNRKRRNKAAQIGEGGADIAWNAATLATDALSFGAASAGTAAIGGSYKALLAAAGVRRAGGSEAKATATGVVVFILETLQGLIPFYSGAAGIGGGIRGAGKALYKTAKKARKKTKGYQRLGDQSDNDDGPEIFQLLKPRLEYGRALLTEASKYSGKRGIDGLVDDLQKELEYLERQMEKSSERLGYGGSSASTAGSKPNGWKRFLPKSRSNFERY